MLFFNQSIILVTCKPEQAYKLLNPQIKTDPSKKEQTIPVSLKDELKISVFNLEINVLKGLIHFILSEIHD